MERHKCKLCSKTFNNGRALGGHMKSHLVPLAKTKKKVGEFGTESASSSSSSPDNKGEKPLGYGLRENPRKSLRFADPEFSFAVLDSGSSVVVVKEDRDSETESKNLVRRRSKRSRNAGPDTRKEKLKKPSLTESTIESQEPMSSVSDTSPEEDVAMCLMMLSKDVWRKKIKEEKQGGDKNAVEILEEANEVIRSKIRSEFLCEKCNKVFGSHRTLVGHKRVCSGNLGATEKMSFNCPFCDKVFASGQALGGHKRSHLVSSSSTAMNSTKPKNYLIDLNLPAPLDDEVSSVVLDAI